MRRSRILLVAATLVVGLLVAFFFWPRSGAPDLQPPSPPAASSRAEEAEEATRPFLRPAALSPAAVAPEAAAAFGAFRGRVVDASSGEGISGAELTFESSGVAFSTSSGPNGVFGFSPQREGVYRMAVITARGFHPFGPAWGHSPVALTAAAGQRVEGLVFQLEPETPVEGVVLAPDGGAVPNAEVQVVQGGAESVGTDARARSGADGSFTLAPPVGSVVEATHPSLGTGRAVVGERHLLGERLRVMLRAPGEEKLSSLHGTVVDAQGQPAPGALVTAYLRRSFRERAQAPDPAPARTVSDADGAFRFDAIREGIYQLQGFLEGVGRGGVARVRTSPAPVELRLLAGAAVRGTVRGEGGAPVAAFTVSLQRKRGALARDAFLTTAMVSAEGRFELEAVPPGTYALQVAAYGYAVSDELQLVVPPDGAPVAPVEVRLGRGGRVFGVVRDDVSKRPIAGAVVSMEGGVETAASSFPTTASTTTDAAGGFSLSGLAEGLRSITVISRAHHGRVLSGLAVREGGDLGPVEVTLTPLEPGETPRMELVGIGAVLTPRGDVLRIGQVIAGGGAAEAGLREGDELWAVDGLRVGELGFEGAVNRIRGPEGSTVLLRVRRGAEPAQERVVYRRRVRN